MIKFENGHHYKFERMDLAALMMIINLIAIIVFNKGAYIGLPVSILGLIWDLREGRHINNVIIRICTAAMNIYFLTL